MGELLVLWPPPARTHHPALVASVARRGREGVQSQGTRRGPMLGPGRPQRPPVWGGELRQAGPAPQVPTPLKGRARVLGQLLTLLRHVTGDTHP